MTMARALLPSRQRGVAVITAMLVVAIATLLAMQIAWETSLDLRRTESMLSWDQAQQYAYGAEAWAQDKLREDPPDTDGLQDDWDGDLTLPLDGGFIEGRLEDLQGRFNLNNLVNSRGEKDENVLAQFQRLLEAIRLPDDSQIPPDDAARIAAAVVDWIDTDTTPEFDGAEDDFYTSRVPAHRAANFWFTSKSELMAVAGMTPAVYAALLPEVAALPHGTRINLNFASEALLQSLGENISDVDAAAVKTDLEKQQCTDPGNLLQIDAGLQNFVACSSSHFGLQIHVRIGTTDLYMYSLLQRNGQAVVPRVRSFARELI